MQLQNVELSSVTKPSYNRNQYGYINVISQMETDRHLKHSTECIWQFQLQITFSVFSMGMGVMPPMATSLACTTI